jgi:hypothetical protein
MAIRHMWRVANGLDNAALKGSAQHTFFVLKFCFISLSLKLISDNLLDDTEQLLENASKRENSD